MGMKEHTIVVNSKELYHIQFALGYVRVKGNVDKEKQEYLKELNTNLDKQVGRKV